MHYGTAICYFYYILAKVSPQLIPFKRNASQN